MAKRYLDNDGFERYAERMNNKISTEIDKATAPLSEKAKTFSVTIPVSAWTEISDGNYNATVTNAKFIKNGYSYHVSPDESTVQVYANSAIFAKNIPADGSMVFTATAIPSIAVVANIMKVEAVNETN